MIATLPTLPGFEAGPLVSTIAVLALKATPFLLVPFAFERLRPRASAAARHLVWFLSLASVLVLPVLATITPGWSVRGLAWPGPAAPPRIEAPLGSTKLDVPAHRSPSVAVVAPPRALDELESVSPMRDAARAAAPAPAQARAKPLLPLGTAAWILGVSLVLGRLAAARRSLRSLARSARPLREAEWTALVDEARRQLALQREVELLRGAADVLPMTWGLRRTRVLLPSSAEAWPEPRRRAVIRHELAHARRHDCLTQLGAQIACALFWFHPLVWYAARRMQVERERACDDLVLGIETRPSEYAEHLVAVVRSLREARGLAFGAVGFARRSEFEGRLLAVLDPKVDRRPLTATVARWAGVAALVLIAPIAALQSAATTTNATSVRLIVPNEMLLNSQNAPAGRLVGGSSDVRKAPETQADLDQRWAWAKSQKAGDAQWVGWWIDRGDADEGNLLSDSDGLWLGNLNGRWTGPTLEDVLLGRAPSRERRGDRSDRRLAILLHRTRGTVDRVRAQSLSLPAELGEQPVLWLGHGDVEPSLALLDQLMSQSHSDKSRARLLELISFHASTELVVPKLESRLGAREPEVVRRQAVEGLGRQSSERSVVLLEKAMLSDPSQDVRQQAAEALGQIHEPGATDALTRAARRDDVSDETKHQIYEALADQASKAGADALGSLVHEGMVEGEASESDAPSAEAEAKAEAQAEAEAYTDAVDAAEVAPSEDPEQIEKNAKVLERSLARQQRDLARLAGKHGKGDEEGDLQEAAVENFRQFPAEVARPKLREIARKHPRIQVRAQAVETLARFGDPADIPFLEEIARTNPVEDIAFRATEGMRNYPADAVAPALQRLYTGQSATDVRHQALETLAQLDGGPGLPFFEKLIFASHEEDDVQCAIDNLRRFPDEQAAPLLERIAKTHPNMSARRSALETLTHMDPERALPVMEALLKDGKR